MHDEYMEMLQRLVGRPLSINPLWEVEHEQLVTEVLASYLMHHYFTADEAYDLVA